MPRPLAAALVLALALALPVPARAWSAAGHRVIAAIAAARLTPPAERLVREVLGAPLTAPGIATWADDLGDRSTKPWHYVNIPFSARGYDAARDCPRGACVVAAIERFSAALEGGASDAARADALRWLVHLVADVHQPLHAGKADDRGGNDLAIRVAGRRQPTNLHRVWDHDVVDALVGRGGPEAAGAAIAARIAPADAAAWARTLAPAAWASESAVLARAIYAELERHPSERGYLLLPRDHAAGERGRAEEALARAGVRLAALLDRIAVARPSRAQR